MRIQRPALGILPILLAACGGPDTTWWLTADRANAEVSDPCIGQPQHEVHGYATLWTGDERALDLADGGTYTGAPDGHDLDLAWVWDTGRRIDANFALDLEGGVLRGDWRHDDTTVSGVTCATSAPVELHPIQRTRGVWQLSGDLSTAISEPAGCRGDFGPSAYTMLLTAYDLENGQVGAHLNADPVQFRPRYFSGTAAGRDLTLGLGGAFDTGSTSSMVLSLSGAAASLDWDQDGCLLTLRMHAESQ